MPSPLLEALRAACPEVLLGSHAVAGDDTVLVAREHVLDLMLLLRNDPRFRMEQLVDVTAVDFLEYAPELRGELSPLDAGPEAVAALPRYEIVYHLLSMTLRHRLRVKVPLRAEDLHIPTLCGVWLAANWGEREVYDMYGVQFDGHPDLRRILLYQEFEGHPLRKDYPLRGYQPLVPMPELVHYTDHETFR